MTMTSDSSITWSIDSHRWRDRCGNLLLDVLLVRADQPRQRHVAVVDLQRVALAEQRFRQDDHRRFAQVVGARLEAEPEQPDLLLAGFDDPVDRVLHLEAVAAQHRVDERHVEVHFLGAVLQRAHVLRQARAAEREPRLQVVGRQIQLVVLCRRCPSPRGCRRRRACTGCRSRWRRPPSPHARRCSCT